jgi:dTDP-glucose pyrophosphorylase
MSFINEIGPELALVDCLKRMDEIGKKLLVITENGKFINVLSIGDIQRAIINNVDLQSRADSITREIITVASSEESIEEIKQKMVTLRTECMPVVDSNGLLADIIYWEDIISDEKKTDSKPINIPVVIMAGGKGTRLKPLTNVIPKPLIPVGDKTMIETIIDSFRKHDCEKFHLSVNYKADLIEYYLKSVYNDDIEINYFQEDKPLGTAGSLFMLKDKIDGPFFVSNCDILVKQDYSEILDYHKQNKNELTVVGALRHFSIPYGTLETGESGVLQGISEKPELTYLINSGLYILESHLIDEIPENEFYHITSLINKLMSENRRVGVFPVSEKSWIDIGEWKEYYKNINLGQ